MSRIYVLAENYQHFQHWCRISGINPRTARYVSAPQDLWGVSGQDVTFIKYETWRNHPQAAELDRQLRHAELVSSPPARKKVVVEPPNNSFWYRLVNLDPALFRGLVVAVVALLATLGVTIAPGVPDQVIAIVWLLSAIIQALWTRGGVTPNAKVAVSVPDPINEPEKVEAGGAVTTAPNHEIIAAATTQG